MKCQLSNSSAQFGTVEISAAQLEMLSPPLRPHVQIQNTHERYVWRPPATLVDQLPVDFKIAWDCYTDLTGMRRFIQVGGHRALLHWGFLAGLAILSHVKNLTGDHRRSYRLMKLVFERTQATQEHLNRQLLTARDLFVRRPGRESAKEWSLLPDHVGINSAGKGRRWLIKTLLTEGRAAAREAGIEELTNAIAIPYGLTAAARLNPLAIEQPEQARTLVRTALFDMSAIESEVSPQLIELVNERLFCALERHYEDSAEKFDYWFMPSKGSVQKALVGGKRSPGGKLTLDDVNRVLLFQGWEACGYMTGCLQACLRWFAQSLPQPLTPDERQQFEYMYFPQACYGGLPLVFLMDRSALIGQTVAELWKSPTDHELIGVLHRLLSYYAEIASERRKADRRFPKTAAGKRHQAMDVKSSVAPPASLRKPSQRTFDRIAAKIAVNKKLRCPNCDGRWAGRLDPEQPRADYIQINIYCECENFDTTLSVRRTTFEKLAQTALPKQPNAQL